MLNNYISDIIKKEGAEDMKKYNVGEIVTGCVTGIEKYGVFVGLDEYYSGLIHISEISDDYVRNIHDYVKIGETIKAKVIEENAKTHHVKLSIKNIEYRISRKNCRRIIETPQGFSTIKKELNVWIDKKINEITKEKQKN